MISQTTSAHPWFLLAIAGALSCSSAWAGAVTVLNPSFESPLQAVGTYTSGPGGITDWTNTGASGVFRPGTGVYFNSVPDGDQIAYNQGGTISQTLSDVLVTSTLYTLEVEVGTRLDGNYGFSPVVQLLAGSTVLGTATVPANPGFGNWATATLTYTSGATDALAGQALSIVLGGNTDVNNYDNVRLTASSVTSQTPEPSTFPLVGVAGLAVIVRMRRVPPGERNHATMNT